MARLKSVARRSPACPTIRDERPDDPNRPAKLAPKPIGVETLSPHVVRERRTSNAHCSSSMTPAVEMAALQEDPEDDAGPSKQPRKHRGSARGGKLVPPDGQRWVVEYNKHGQPVGEVACKLNRRIGIITKQYEIWPVDRKWIDQSRTSYDDTWMLLVNHFDFQNHHNARRYVFHVLQARLRDWKAELKKYHYLPYNNDVERINHRPSRVERDQWKNLLSYWSTETAKVVSEKNKVNRAHKTMNHRSGTMSFARLSRKMREQEGREQSPTRLEVMYAAYKPKEGQSNTSGSATILAQLRDYVDTQQTQQPEQSETGPRTLEEIEEEALSRVMGPEKSDRMRGVGIGAMKKSSSTSAYSKYSAKDASNSDDQLATIRAENKQLRMQNTTLLGMMQDLYSHMGLQMPPMQNGFDGPEGRTNNESEQAAGSSSVGLAS